MLFLANFVAVFPSKIESHANRKPRSALLLLNHQALQALLTMLMARFLVRFRRATDRQPR
jgi:hypothetical protein